MPTAKVQALSKSPTHTFSKTNESNLQIRKNWGVEGDAHAGETVKHRSRVAQDPSLPNLRQVHLIHSELFEELAKKGFSIAPGQMGENITTEGIALLGLPRNSRLLVGDEVVLEVTGLRNPCNQLNGIQEGLLQAVLDRDDQGNLIRKAGIMCVVLQGGLVKIGDLIKIELPEPPYLPLERV